MQLRIRVFGAQVRKSRIRVIGEGHMTYAFIRCGDQHRAERGRGVTPDDAQVRPAVLVLAGGHALNGDERIVQAPRAAEPARPGRIERALLPSERRLRPFKADMLQHFLGAHSRPLLELPLQVFRVHVNGLGYLRERGLICGVVIQVLDSGGYAPELDGLLDRVCARCGTVCDAQDSPSSRS